MDEMITKSNNNPSVTFRQGADGNFFIDPDGLYLVALFVPAKFAVVTVADALALYKDIQNGMLESRNALGFGSAIALPRISGSTAERHILALTSEGSETGYYWDGTSSDGMGATSDQHYIITLLITPDARFILRSDFFFNGGSPLFPTLFGNSDKYTIDFNEITRKFTMFHATPTQHPEELLPNDFIDYFVGRLS
jgi:hypothetical protein